jgi:hypothetical protein
MFSSVFKERTLEWVLPENFIMVFEKKESTLS